MLSSTLILTTLLPFLAAATTVGPGVSTTIVPFGTLPLCAQQCGPLFDAQGACGQTALTPTSQKCFCSYGSLQAFYTTNTGVCATAAGCSSDDLTAIRNWFASYCSSSSTGGTVTTTAANGAATTKAATGNTGTTGSTGSSGTTTGSTTTTAPASPSWISTHYQWVIMIVVVCSGLAALWILAAWLRRRYIRKRERAFELRPPTAPWGPNESHNFGPSGPPPMTMSGGAAGVFSQNSRSNSPAGYAGKGKSPLSREVPSEVSLSENYGKKSKRISKSQITKLLPTHQRT